MTDADERAYQKLKKRYDTIKPVFPIRFMAKELGTGNGYIQRLMARLEKEGMVRRVKYGKTVRYEFL